MRLIDADALYERAANLDAQALEYVGKLIERDGDKPSTEWRIWSAILTERSAFKHDVFDAPTIEPERKTGKWIWDDEGYHCSECFFHAYGNTLECLDGTYQFCPNCGADMRGEQDG